jgi:DNA-binding NarL/FixJ family response regulator
MARHERYTILIADDHPLLRSAVVQSLRQSLPLAQARGGQRRGIGRSPDAQPGSTWCCST